MEKKILGIHHVTAIAGDPQQNVDFYVGLLGLRLVKKTVNFDAPDTYHLYYGDGVGTPGTILTFFPWPKTPRGRQGTGQITVTAFAIPAEALPYWIERFQSYDIPFAGPITRFTEEVLAFSDPDGLQLELVTSATKERFSLWNSWQDGPIPPEYALRGFHSVTLAEAEYKRTTSLLTETLGFRLIGAVGNRSRYGISAESGGALVDVLDLPHEPPGQVLVGTVHHVAWRVENDAGQERWRQEIMSRGFNVTPMKDRNYFHSIYFREPGGVLFEMATDPPGFTIDESLEQLGTNLKLPSWLEPKRGQLEHILPALHLPEFRREV
jgi:glyoxalase family protein